MKKILLLLLVTGLLTSAGFADNTIERGYISINTTANTEIIPDVAEISIAVKTYDNKSMQKATLQNKEISDKVISTLKTMINASNGDYIKTSDFNASPLYTYTGNKKNFDKYQVQNSVVIHTKNIDKVGSMIDKAIALGATNVNSLSFSVSNYENQCNDLLKIATQKAYTRADIVAKTVQTSLAGVRTIDLSCNANNSYHPQYRMLKSNMVMSDAAGTVEEASSTAIEQGVVKIYANVNASFFVK